MELTEIGIFRRKFKCAIIFWLKLNVLCYGCFTWSSCFSHLITFNCHNVKHFNKWTITSIQEKQWTCTTQLAMNVFLIYIPDMTLAAAKETAPGKQGRPYPLARSSGVLVVSLWTQSAIISWSCDPALLCIGAGLLCPLFSDKKHSHRLLSVTSFGHTKRSTA